MLCNLFSQIKNKCLSSNYTDEVCFISLISKCSSSFSIDMYLEEGSLLWENVWYFYQDE